MNQNNSDWYSIYNINELDSPALVVYPARVKQNIRTAIEMIGDANRLRPHIKTNKSPDVTRLMIDAGINKFKCATIAEAEMLAMSKAKDVLLAYQPVGPKLSRFVALVKKYPATKFSCLVDNADAATEMSEIFVADKMIVPVFIDLNVGQNRTGIEAGKDALQLYIACTKMDGIRAVGLHAYDGHIRDIDWNMRKENCDKAFATVEQLKKEIMKAGLPEPILIIGGSPTFSIHCKRKNVECSPGTFVYWDKGYIDLCPEQAFVPAALVISRVVSMPGKSKICIDLGHKSIAAENELSRRVYFLNAPELKFIGQSEEHLVVESDATHHYKIHDIFYGMPIHICPTVALYERAYTVEDHMVNGEWKTIARDKKISV
ncbi:MAG: D-TA family PLP-dependent enzyme [Bacteroidetes bacterium]|nr:D-TA family PLP-dependent enzyme [Bacteroidota bacterium]